MQKTLALIQRLNESGENKLSFFNNTQQEAREGITIRDEYEQDEEENDLKKQSGLVSNMDEESMKREHSKSILENKIYQKIKTSQQKQVQGR